MKKITVLSGLLLLAGLAAQAQERVAEYNVRPAVTVRTPLQGDSINFKGDKFTTGNLLKTKVSLDFDGGRYERMVADTAGYVTVAKADKDNLFYLFATNLRAERFMKGKLNVYSPARFEGKTKAAQIKRRSILQSILPFFLKFPVQGIPLTKDSCPVILCQKSPKSAGMITMPV